jgi:hypothetical protein
MAAALPPLYSALYGDAARWENPTPSYETLCDALGYSAGAACLAAPAFRTNLTQLSMRSPLVAAFMLRDDPDCIYVAHSLTVFATDLTAVTPMDDKIVGVVGDNPNSSVSVVFSDDFLSVRVATRAKTVADIVTDHGAIPALLRTGPHAAAVAGTEELRARPLMILPPQFAARFLTTSSDGRYSLNGFYNSFLLGPNASADAAEQALWRPLMEWWRLASTNIAGDVPCLSHALVPTGSPRDQARLVLWGNRVKDLQLSRMGVGGPQLTNTAFARGIQDIQDTLTIQHNDTLRAESRSLSSCDA